MSSDSADHVSIKMYRLESRIDNIESVPAADVVEFLKSEIRYVNWTYHPTPYIESTSDTGIDSLDIHIKFSMDKDKDTVPHLRAQYPLENLVAWRKTPQVSKDYPQGCIGLQFSDSKLLTYHPMPDSGYQITNMTISSSLSSPSVQDVNMYVRRSGKFELQDGFVVPAP